MQNRGCIKVFTNGVFDLFHYGHFRTLQFARQLGSELFVAVDSDERVKSNKGLNRPIIPQKYRLELLKGLICVDKVEIFNSQEEFFDLIISYKPDFYVKAGYNLKTLNQDEKTFIESKGIKIIFADFFEEISTTKIIEKIAKNYGN